MTYVWVLWRGPGHRVNTCVWLPEDWLELYRARVVSQWHGVVLGVYYPKA